MSEGIRLPRDSVCQTGWDELRAAGVSPRDDVPAALAFPALPDASNGAGRTIPVNGGVI